MSAILALVFYIFFVKATWAYFLVVLLLFSGCFWEQKNPEDTVKNTVITHTPSPISPVVEAFEDIKNTTNTQKLSQSAESTKTAVRAFSAENPHTSEEDLWKLADDEQLAVRSYLATNSALPKELFAKLVQDPSETVRGKIAYNPSTPPEILQTLYSDTSVVQEHLVMNTSLSEDIMVEMAQKLSAISALQRLAQRRGISDRVKEALKKRNIESVTKELE